MLGAAVEAIPACVDSDGEVLSEPFFAACRLVLPVIGEAHLCQFRNRPGVRNVK